MDAAVKTTPPAGGLLETKAAQWARANLFSSWASTAGTLVLAYVLIKFAIAFISWALFNAVWTVESNNTQVCRDLRGIGACWAFVTEKYRFILFGTYPFEQHWRPTLAILVFIGLYGVSALRRFWNAHLIWIWLAGLTAIGVLMWGGVFGLRFVENERWGGLVITLALATFGIAIAFPVGILLALGRRSDMPAVKAVCVIYIEMIRGVPLVSLLFMASVMLPLFLPEGVTIDKLVRAQVAIIMFAAAYLAEVVRGGLQAIPKGQYEAADGLGLSYWQKMGKIILPQAIAISIPPLVNTFISFFKDTSLVIIIGLFDLLGTVNAALADANWQGFYIEAYIVAAAIYFGFCYFMSRYSLMLEREFNKSRER